MLSRIIAVFSALMLVLVASAQVHYRNDPNVIIPNSSLPVQPGYASSHYLRYVGPAKQKNIDPIHHDRNFKPAVFDGYTPSQVKTAYHIPSNGGGGTIAIVDAFDLPTALDDFNAFSSTFGLPIETSHDRLDPTNKVFQVVQPQGPPGIDPSGSWAGEIALDIEWAHAMAPRAKIILVECFDNSLANLADGEVHAKLIDGVRQVSNSWGSAEFLGEDATFGNSFKQAGVTFFASTGDIGGLVQCPSSLQDVVGVGGTSLFMSGSQFLQETGWSGAGGGVSAIILRPAFQNVVQTIVGAHRGAPDIGAIADPNTGAAVYSVGAFGGWAVIGGTSLACPVCAGITNVRKAYKNSSTEELSRVYSIYASGTSKLYRDITKGTAGGNKAQIGYDLITGVGVPTNVFLIPMTLFYPATGASVVTGSATGGNIDSLTTAGDDDQWTIHSSLIPVLGQTSGVQVGFVVDRPPSGYGDLQIATQINVPPNATIQIQAYNWVNARYEVVRSFSGRNAPAQSTSLPHREQLYGPSNNLSFIIRAFVNTRYGRQPVDMNLDLVQLAASEP